MREKLKQLACVGAAIMLLASAGIGLAHAANDGLVDDAPVTVGTTKGKDRDGDPKNPTTTSGRTESDGGLGLDLKNDSNRTAKDVHVRVDKPADAEITTAVWSGDGNFVMQSTGNTLVAHGSLPHGDTAALELIIEDKDGNPLDKKDVKLSIWWTRGANHNIVLSATSPDTIGAGDPMTALSSLGIPGYTENVVQVSDGTDEADLNVVVLAECHGFRFQEGSLVVSTNEGQSFAMGTLGGDELEVSAWDEDGNQVTTQQRISFSDPRIDVDGNFVIDVDRAQDDDKHIVIVIRNLRVTGMNTRAVDDPITVSFSGAAIGGGSLDDLYDIVEVVWS